MAIKVQQPKWKVNPDGSTSAYGRQVVPPPPPPPPPPTGPGHIRLLGTKGSSLYVVTPPPPPTPPPSGGTLTYPSFGTLAAYDSAKLTSLVQSGAAVTWESLILPTDSFATRSNPDGGPFYAYGPGVMQSILNRVPSGKGIVMKNGVFEANEPGWNNGDQAALQVPKYCTGIYGNAPPGTGWDDIRPTTVRTTIRVAPNSSDPLNVLGGWFKYGYSGSMRIDFANLHFEGTEQGMQTSTGGNVGQAGVDGVTHHRLFTNLFGWTQAKGNTIRDCLATGWSGSNGAPPGETFGFEFYHITDGIVARLYSDGRRAAGGPIYGAVGFTFGYAVNCIAIDCYSHHNGHAGWVHYVTQNCKTYNLSLGDPVDHTTRHVTLNNTKGDWLNHELTGGNIHYNPTLNCFPVNKAAAESVSHSGRAFSFTQDGATFDVSSGTLEIVDPTIFTNLLYNGAQMIWIASWGPSYDGQPSVYADGNPVPIVRKANNTKVAFRWNYSSGWLNF